MKPVNRVVGVLAAMVLICARAGLSAESATTQPRFDFKPGVDRVMDQLRDESTRDAAERIIRGFPAEALPIARRDLATTQKDLPADVRVEVQRILDRNRDARAHAAKLAADYAQWSQAFVKDGYAQSGHHGAWDNDALAAMLSVMSPKPDMELFTKPTSDGCDDPLFYYMNGKGMELTARRYTGLAERREVYTKAADAMETSTYPPIYKCFAELDVVLTYMDNNWPAQPADVQRRVRDRLDKALAWFGASDQKPELPPRIVVWTIRSLHQSYCQILGGNQKAYDTIYPVISRALPGSTLVLNYTGNTYVDLAWDARGRDWANTVTDQGWKGMAQCLQVARDALTEAVRKDPYDWAGAAKMITVVLGEGSGRDEMERWFIKAVEAHPDNGDAYANKVYFLEPKWFGSKEDMLAFGRECLATQNTSKDVAQTLLSAHNSLSCYAAKEYISGQIVGDYFRNNEEAWQDISAFYKLHLVFYPNDFIGRSWYVRYAVWAGHDAEAEQQLSILGKRATPMALAGKAEMEQRRAKGAAGN